MADNKQNSETKNIDSAAGDKSAVTGSGAASTQQAKETNSAAGKSGGKPGDLAGGAAQQSGGNASPQDVIGQAKEAGGQIATEAVGQVKEKASSVIDEQKTNLASGISSVAESIRHIGENLGGTDGGNNQIAALAGKYGDTLAGQVEKFSSYIEDRELKELVRDVEQFAKRNPALFVGGAFMLGILAARFLKSSGSSQSSKRRSQKS